MVVLATASRVLRFRVLVGYMLDGSRRQTPVEAHLITGQTGRNFLRALCRSGSYRPTAGLTAVHVHVHVLVLQYNVMSYM